MAEFYQHLRMPDVLITLLILAIGLSLFFSIVWIRLAVRLGILLLKIVTCVRFPSSENVQLKLQKSDRPRRIVLKFIKSIGFYSGDISLRSDEVEIYRCNLPVLPEYRNKSLHFYNEDIPRKTNILIIPIRNFTTNGSLALHLNLKQNIQDARLRTALDVTSEEEIEIVVRGQRI